mgnify:CR=1 FL=1
MQKKKKYIILTAVVVITLLTTSGSAIAHAMGGKNHIEFSFNSKNGHRGGGPGMGGAVAAIALNGTSLTITGQDGTTYTVDTSKAKITRGFGPNTEALTLADIKVGDKIGVMGTISGTNITAKTIIDGVGMLRDKKTTGQEKTHIVGKILTVSPFSLTIEVKPFRDHMMGASTETLTYTVDSTSNTTVTKDGVTASLGDLAVGQMVIATGKVDSTAKTVGATKMNIMTLKAKPAGLFNRMGRMMRK